MPPAIYLHLFFPSLSRSLSLSPEVNALESTSALEMRAGLDRTASWVFITPNKKRFTMHLHG